jgi:hypothetical protein
MDGDFRSTKLCILCCHHLKVMFVFMKHQRAQIIFWHSGNKLFNTRMMALERRVTGCILDGRGFGQSCHFWNVCGVQPASVHKDSRFQFTTSLVPVTCQTGGDLTCSRKSSQFIIYPFVFLCMTSLPSVHCTYSRQIILLLDTKLQVNMG